MYRQSWVRSLVMWSNLTLGPLLQGQMKIARAYNLLIIGSQSLCNHFFFYPTALKGCWGIVFTHGVWMGGRVAGKSLSGLYLRNRTV